MKKLAFIGSLVTSLLTPVQTLAASIDITPPTVGFKTLGDAISKILTVSFIIALVMVLIMLMWGAFEWIASGGDKDNVGKARGRIINALVGLAVLAIAFALFRFAGQFVGFGPTAVPDASDIKLDVPTPK